MNLLDLVYDCRIRADDLGGDTGTVTSPYTYYWEQYDSGCLWKNAEWVRFLNQAHQEIALRTNCYCESSDAILCNIAVVSGTNSYELDSKILTVENVRLASTHAALVKWTLRDYRDTADAYTATGDPQYYFEESHPFRMTLYPIPDATDTLYLTVYRYPLDDLSWSQRKTSLDEPGTVLREALIQGALMLAYQKRDSDAADIKRQIYHEAQFQKLVGPPVDYRTLENRRWNANLDVNIRPARYIRPMSSSSWMDDE